MNRERRRTAARGVAARATTAACAVAFLALCFTTGRWSATRGPVMADARENPLVLPRPRRPFVAALAARHVARVERESAHRDLPARAEQVVTSIVEHFEEDTRRYQRRGQPAPPQPDYLQAVAEMLHTLSPDLIEAVRDAVAERTRAADPDAPSTAALTALMTALAQPAP